ncbi:MAG: flagellar biosynthetic protein FliO, partial [bacterium]
MFTRQGMACVVLVLSLLLVFPSLTAAQENNFNSDDYLSGELSTDTVAADTDFGAKTEFNGSGEAGVDLFWLILKISGVLVFISGGIYGLARLLKSSGLAGGNNDFMQVISSLSVGQEKYLQVVKIGKQFLVIGVTDGSINRVCEINDGETI